MQFQFQFARFRPLSYRIHPVPVGRESFYCAYHGPHGMDTQNQVDKPPSNPPTGRGHCTDTLVSALKQ